MSTTLSTLSETSIRRSSTPKHKSCFNLIRNGNNRHKASRLNSLSFPNDSERKRIQSTSELLGREVNLRNDGADQRISKDSFPFQKSENETMFDNSLVNGKVEQTTKRKIIYESIEEFQSDVTSFLLLKGATSHEVTSLVESWSKANENLEFENYFVFAGDEGKVIPTNAAKNLTANDWVLTLEQFLGAGFNGSDLSTMIRIAPQILNLSFNEQVFPVLNILRKELGLRPTDVRRILRRFPSALVPRPDKSDPKATISALQELGLKSKQIGLEIIKWPRLLCCPPSALFELSEWLVSDELGMGIEQSETKTVVLSIIRQAPWLTEHDLNNQLKPVAFYLKYSLEIQDMKRVLRAYPQILCLSIELDIEPRISFLLEKVKMNKADIPRVIQSFPLLFAIPIERMERVVDFLRNELLIQNADIVKIARAFPSLLGLEPEKHMRSVVVYMKELGIQNIGRFVTRLPPVLGYDVQSNLSPKMDYLVSKMGLSIYDVLTFPAYFSYPLDSIIEPRTEFLSLRRRPIALVGLNVALTIGDNDFAKKVAKVDANFYADFKAAYLKNRSSIINGKMDCQDLVKEMGNVSVGNLGGLSTSSNVKEITEARVLEDVEAEKKFGKGFKKDG